MTDVDQPRPDGRRRHFLSVIALLAGAIVASELLATALFLDVAGAEGLTLYFILIAVATPLASVAVHHVTGRLGNALTLAPLSIALAGVGLVAGSVPAMPLWGVYAIYLAVGVLQLVLIAVVGLLVTEHFTITEGRTLGSAVALWTALGSAGGAVAVALSITLFPAYAAFSVAAAASAGSGVLALTFNRAHPALPHTAAADDYPNGTEEGRVRLAHLLRHDRLAALVAGGTLVAIVIQCVLEWLAYGVYVRAFPQFADLAGFMALVVGGLHLFALGLGAATGRLVSRSGIAAAHLAYPCCALISFGVVGATGTLPAALLAHTASDPLERSMNEPVTNLLYNGLDRASAQRLRLFAGGALAPLGIGLAGIILLAAEPLATPTQVAFAGATLTLFLGLVHFEAGRRYQTAVRNSMHPGLFAHHDTAPSNVHTVGDDEIRQLCENDGTLLERLTDLGALSEDFARRQPFCALAIFDFRERVGQALLNQVNASLEPVESRGLRLFHAFGDVRERARAVEAASFAVDERTALWLRLALDDTSLASANQACDDAILRLLCESGDRWLTVAAQAASGDASENPDEELGDLAFLKRTAAFSELGLDDIAKVRAAMATHRLSPDEVLMRAGDDATAMYVVKQGAVRICSPKSSGANLLHVALEADVIGEMALLDATPRSADAIAAGPAVLLRLDRAAFLDLAAARPTVLLGLSRLLVRRVRRANTSL